MLNTNETLSALDAVIIEERGTPNHSDTLGFSVIGDSDELTLWHLLRWSFPVEPYTAERCRAHRTGLETEKTIIKELRKANFRVFDRMDNGEQYTYYFLGGHLKGKVDVIVIGMPELGKNEAAPGDIKAIRQTDFNRLLKVGVRQWNEEYWTQVQCAIASTETKTGFLIAECKNTGRRYIEFIPFDEFFWAGCLSKAKRVLTRQDPPPSIYKPTDRQVAHFMTDEQRRIYQGKALPAPNCRNCKYAEPIIDDSIDGRWLCHLHQKTIDIEIQKDGCHKHEFIKAMIPNKATQNIDSLSLHALSKTEEITDGLLQSQWQALNEIICVNLGNEVPDIKCRDCQHFVADDIGDGKGVGECKQNAEQTKPYYPEVTRNCNKFSRNKPLIKGLSHVSASGSRMRGLRESKKGTQT